jgi:cytochrome P450
VKEMKSGQDARDAGWRHAYQPFSPPQAQNLHEVWSRIRDEEPVFYSEAMGAWVVSRYHDARAVLTDPRRFSSEGTKAAIGVPPPAAQAILDEGDPIGRARSLLDSDPPHHTEVRRVINEAFKGREVRKIEPDIRALANEIIDGIEPLGFAEDPGLGQPGRAPGDGPGVRPADDGCDIEVRPPFGSG